MQGIIASSVQMFFAWRVLILTKTKLWTIIIGCLAVAGGGALAFNRVEI